MTVFLERIGMGRFESILRRQGYVNLELLLQAPEDALKALDIPLGFRIKFNKMKAEIMASQSIEDNGEQEVSTILTTQPHSEILPKNESKPAKSLNSHGVSTGIDAPTSCLDIPHRLWDSNPTQYCYGCFNKVVEEQRSDFCPERVFCSQMCMKLFFLDKTIICPNPHCRAVSLKNKGVCHEGQWYCSPECTPELSPVDASPEENIQPPQPSAAILDHRDPQPVSSHREEIDLDFDF